MGTVLIDTYDLAEAEQLLSASYTKLRVTAPVGTPTHTRIVRSMVGSLAVDDVSFDYDLQTHADPLPNIILTRIRSGVFEQNFPDGHVESTRADGVMAVGARADAPLVVRAFKARYDALSVDRSLLGRVAAGPNRQGEPASVTLTAGTPVSAAAYAHLASVIDHITHHVLTNPHAAASPLVADSVTHYLASAMLEAFPNTALFEPSIEDRHDSTPALLRKAVAFIDDNANREISVVDIAEAIYVSPRALQYMFRKHLDTTPMEYLRRVRLHQAHLALVAGDRMKTTVGQIAADWGFSHLGRFATSYRQHYGVSPHQTLRG